MKYFIHESTALNQDLIVKLYSKYGFEGYGIYFAILERIAFMECPIDKKLAIFTLRLSKRQQKILDFCIEIELILEDKSEIFEENILENAKKYLIKKEKTREKIKLFREKHKNNNSTNQIDNENVTGYDTVTYPLCNQNVTTVKKSKLNKINISKEEKESEFKTKIFSILQESKNGLLEYFSANDWNESKKFFNYWAEANKVGKLKYEIQKTFDLKKRLETWKLNGFGNKSNDKGNDPNKHELVR
jgi:hypothetical protein